MSLQSKSVNRPRAFPFAPWRWPSWPCAARLIAILGGCVAATGQTPTNLPAITSVAQVRALTPVEANDRYPVHLKGIATFYDPSEFWALFIMDPTGGMFIKLSKTNHVVPGDRVEIQGYSDPGDFAPMVQGNEVRVLSHGELPPPKKVSFDELATGREDGGWVEVRGIVRVVRPASEGRSYIELRVDGERLSGLVTSMDAATAARVINSTVRLRGVCYSRLNSRRQLRAPWLAITDGTSIQIERSAEQDAVTVPLANLLQYNSEGLYGRRVRVKGAVALQQPGRALFIVDGNQGLRVKTQQTTRVALGEIVEVTGYPSLGQYSPILEDATFRRVELGEAPQPIEAQIDQLLNDTYDAALVKVRAKLLNQVHGWRELTLVLEGNSTTLNAHLDGYNEDPRLTELESGTELELTGVCVLQPVENWNPSINSRPQSFQLLLRSADDVTVIAQPPWWTLPRLLWAVSILSVGAVAGFSWIVVLDRRVRRQTRIIQEKAQRAAALEERSRIAREFHDTLEQELAAISMQLDTVSAQFDNAPEIAREMLDLARNMSRRSLAEARRSVWDLRSHLLENSDLATALTEVAKALAVNSQSQIVVSTAGSRRKLPGSIESNLLRLTQEATTNALKHARASHIAIHLTYLPKRIQLEVTDDGVGFDPRHCPSIDEGHFGLLDMGERVERMGGHLNIESAPGRGTRIAVEVADHAGRDHADTAGEAHLEEAV